MVSGLSWIRDWQGARGLTRGAECQDLLPFPCLSPLPISAAAEPDVRSPGYVTGSGLWSSNNHWLPFRCLKSWLLILLHLLWTLHDGARRKERGCVSSILLLLPIWRR